jgi:hypothetical protein
MARRYYGDVARHPERGSKDRGYNGSIQYRIKRSENRAGSDYWAYVCLSSRKGRKRMQASPKAWNRAANLRCADGSGKTPTSALKDGLRILMGKI